MKPVTSLNLSDIHLGHRRIDPEIMSESLWSFIQPQLQHIKLLVIQGDIFDTSVSLADAAAPFVLKFLIALLKECHERDITVRIMRGTFSHDRKQMINIPVIHKECGYTNDLKYYDSISLEYIERFDMRVLYIPDNVPYGSSDDVMAEVKRQMDALGWETIDYAHVHGYFDFVLPDAAHDIKVVFRPDQFYFVTRFVDVGHVHQHAMCGNIIYNGSTERLAHNEEEAKGMVLIEDQVKDAKVTFLENKNATVFKSFDYSTSDILENIQADFEEKLNSLDMTRPVYIRIIHPRSDVRMALGQYLRDHYPMVRYSHSKGSTTKSTSVSEDVHIPQITNDMGSITEENLPDLVTQYIVDKNKHQVITPDEVKMMIASLKEG